MDDNFSDFKSEVAPERIVLLAVAASNFHDMEYQGIRKVLIEAGYTVEITSLREGECHGTHGTVVHSRIAFSELVPANYLALVFLGGLGTINMIDNEGLLALVQKFAGEGKVLGALSDAPLLLIHAGVLPAGATLSASDTLRQTVIEAGFNYSDHHVSVDGLFITANNYQAAQEFAHELLGMFNETDGGA